MRIEDTDQTREVKGAVEALISTLQKIGLNWDEGPFADKTFKMTEKGQNGPYFQSKRAKIYREYAQKLVSSNKAYFCTCSAERLEQLRKEQEAKKLPPKYDGLCRENTQKPIGKFVIRLKVPTSGEVVFNDSIRGEIKISVNEIDDQVLIKSDGFPTYHLANVVDDHLMGITHVIRGEEWLPSTPKHILLYQGFGWNLPVFAHLPLLLNKDRSKLSKRQGDVATEDYLNKGYLPEAIINYVALLGWHPKDDRELFGLKQLVKEFDLKRVQKAGAIFDVEKLNWFNCEYLKKKSNKELAILAKRFLPRADEATLQKIVKVEKERINYLEEICERSQYFFNLPNYKQELLVFKKSDKETTLKSLKLILENLNKLREGKWKVKHLHKILEQMVKGNNLANGDVFWPARVAVSGLAKSPSPEEIMEVLGKTESLKRIQKAISVI
ncbi:MAG: Glutamate-tRNA ligase [Candidatus Nomurabacteria bacterium GW2011_GWA2_40_9]|uniref:Glutamate--tRNA ligase n=1 Tax=Candidatus Nomurabacteria bacterium GW2011_GWA2_40_9 TaxID=1618734 RepID=A0A0G0W3F1_9BACT|nr:MAG: Glutamate-tRNA ligase [Candidatus Nomurabacteria bacterium GW2011_GWA2_40_9]